MKKLLILALAAIGAATILGGVAFFVFGPGFLYFGMAGGSDYKIEKTVPSPSGAYVATLYTGMGGGAAGWCSQVISINTVSEPFSLEVEKNSGQYQVFRASCSAKVTFQWLSNSALQIGFAGTDQGGLSLYLKPMDYSGQVTVEYSLGA
jgi:hypothetical protein